MTPTPMPMPMPMPTMRHHSSSSSSSSSFCYVSRKQIEQLSPSRQHGIDARREERLRRSYSVFLQDLGKALELPQQPTIATATILCHRFFLRQSHATNDRFLVAAACLFLAAKSEDTPCPLAEIVAATGRILHMKDPTALDHETELLLLAEHLVLSTLDFDLAIDHPYKPLVDVIRKLKEGHGMQKELSMLGERLTTSKQEVQMGKIASEHVAGQFQERKAAPDYVVFLPKAEDHVGVQSQAGKAASYHVDGHHKAGYHVGGQYKASNHVAGLHIAASDHVVRQYKVARITSDYVGGQFKAEKHACDHVHAHYKSGENAFQQVAWNFVNDGMLTSLCLQLKPHHIAAGAVYLAAKFLGVKLPCEGERMWWREFDVTPLQLQEVGNQILELYVMEGPTFSESASSSDLNSSGITSHSISEKRIQQKSGHGSNEGGNDCNRGRNYQRRYY